MSDIANILRAITKGDNPVPSLVCTVDKIDGRMCDVTPVDTDLAPLKEVRLNAQTDGEAGIVITPKVDSYVLVSLLTENDAFVTMFSEIDKVEFADTSGLEIVSEQGKISIKNKDYSLRKAFDDMLTAIGKLTVTTGVGPSGTPINISEFEAVKTNLDKFLTA